jgi:hypothetical protein
MNTTLTINDLNLSNELDSQALATICGRGEWEFLGAYVATGSWGGYQNRFTSYVGTTFHDGYLSRQYYEGWLRSKTDYEYSYWNQYVRV